MKQQQQPINNAPNSRAAWKLRKQARSQGASEHGYLAFARRFLLEPAFQQLDRYEQVLLVAFMNKFNGTNNGSIFYAVRKIAIDFGMCQSKACKAINGLINAGFLHPTKMKAWRQDDGYLARKFLVRTVGIKKGQSAAPHQIAFLDRNSAYKKPKDTLYRSFLNGSVGEDHPEYAHCLERQRRSKIQGNVKLLRNIINCKRYFELSTTAKALLINLHAFYDGHNNGKIECSAKLAGILTKTSKATGDRALKELEDAGFLRCTFDVGFNYTKATRMWALTMFPEEGFDLPTHAWRKKRGVVLPPKNIQLCTAPVPATAYLSGAPPPD